LTKSSSNQPSSKNTKKIDNKVNEKINEYKRPKLLKKDTKSVIDDNIFNYNVKTNLDIDKQLSKQDYSSN
jgi:hypothetical protein